ncbi:hypothetical protein BJX68DRAFT_233771, partial [Aspergillus pseudodeflectus]
MTALTLGSRVSRGCHIFFRICFREPLLHASARHGSMRKRRSKRFLVTRHRDTGVWGGIFAVRFLKAFIVVLAF